MDNLSRRGLLSGVGDHRCRHAGCIHRLRPPCPLALPATKRFVMGGAGGELFRSKPLWGPTVMQSFAFDTPNNRLFTGQLRSGTPATSGDLTLSQLELLRHRARSHVPDRVRPCRVHRRRGCRQYDVHLDRDRRGHRQRARAADRPLPVAERRDEDVQPGDEVEAVSNGSVFTPAVDQRYGRLGVRYSLSDGMHINVYSLAAARTGDFSTVLASFKQPALTSGIDFQVWALYGSYVYFWEGEAYPGDPTRPRRRRSCGATTSTPARSSTRSAPSRARA